LLTINVCMLVRAGLLRENGNSAIMEGEFRCFTILKMGFAHFSLQNMCNPLECYLVSLEFREKNKQNFLLDLHLPFFSSRYFRNGSSLASYLVANYRLFIRDMIKVILLTKVW